MSKKILIALGGNAIKQADEKGTPQEQIKNCIATCKLIAKLIKKLGKENRFVITHGNGPQVGNLLMQQERAKDLVPIQTLDILGAMTQGQIGYLLQQALINCLKEEGIDIPVCTVITQVLVDKNDPEFSKDAASKPVGNFLTKEEVEELMKIHPEYIIKKVRPEGDKAWRICVPSPDPKVIVEASIIKKLVDSGAIVIACGGGGIPVIQDEKGYYKGVEAVIDKDLASEKLAEVIGVDIFIILTDVEKVKLNFGKPSQRDIDKMSLTEAKKYLDEGYFLPGSMAPKIKACIRFLEWGGEKAIITSLYKLIDAFEGKTGTNFYRD